MSRQMWSILPYIIFHLNHLPASLCSHWFHQLYLKCVTFNARVFFGLIFPVHLAASFDAHYCFEVALIVDVHGGAGVQNLVKHGLLRSSFQ